MNTEKYQTIEEKILSIYSGKAEKLAQRKSAVLKELITANNAKAIEELTRERMVIDKRLFVCKNILNSIRNASSRKNENFSNYVVVLSTEAARLNMLTPYTVHRLTETSLSVSPFFGAFLFYSQPYIRNLYI